MKKTKNFIVRWHIPILILGILLLIPAYFGFVKTKINYDILSYLPTGIDSVDGEHILDEQFSDAATSFLVIRGMDDRDVAAIKQNISKVDGVESVLWKDDVADITVPDSMLPTVLSSTFTSGDSKLLLIQFKNNSSSAVTQKAITSIRKYLNKQCFLSGMSAIVKDTVDLSDAETPRYVLLAVALSLLVMCLLIGSWPVPFLFLISIGFAILYNFGTNIFLGQISYITKALAAVLQIGVTMDFAIFLYNRYEHEYHKAPDKEQAMAKALRASFVPVFGSGMATTCGFLSLGVMRLQLGKDIGFVMAKGVFLSMICTFTILPALILIFNKPIQNLTHPTILPSFKKLGSFVVKKRVPLLIIGLLLLIPAYFGQKNVSVYYNLDRSLPQSMDSVVSLNVLKKDFNMATTHMILVHDTVPSYEISEMDDALGKVDGITNVYGLDDYIGPGIPSDVIPDSVRSMVEKDGYKLILANSSYASSSDQMKTQVAAMQKIIKKYDSKAMLTGEGALTSDLIDISNTDFNNVNSLSVGVVFAVVMLIFGSISLPALLVCGIELAIFINMSVPFYSGEVIPFIASIVVGCIQLAATVDYAILLSSSYRERIRNGENKYDAMSKAVQHSTKSIVTSAMTFFGATFGVYLISTISLLKSLTLLIARGAIISTCVIIFILPALLVLCEPLLEKTSLHWKRPPKLLLGAAPQKQEEEEDDFA
jgi:predicted RND superfamily exporter protein